MLELSTKTRRIVFIHVYQPHFGTIKICQTSYLPRTSIKGYRNSVGSDFILLVLIQSALSSQHLLLHSEQDVRG